VGGEQIHHAGRWNEAVLECGARQQLAEKERMKKAELGRKLIMHNEKRKEVSRLRPSARP